jgi:sugar phosphate isomerase/epimerase
MRFCVSPKPYWDIHGRSDYSIDKCLDELAEMGIKGIDLERPGQTDGLEWDGFALAVRDAAREVGFGISMHAPAVDISAVDADVRGAAVGTLVASLERIGDVLDEAVYVVHPETARPIREPGDDEARMAMCRKSLSELAPVARAGGIRLALENMRHRADNPNRTGMFTDQLTEIINGLDQESVGICFDVGHAHISEGDDLYDAFERNAARIIHIHLADNRGVEDEHLEPGEGGIDMARFHRVIEGCRFQGFVQLEVKVGEGDDPLEFYRRNYQRFVLGYARPS